MISLLHQLATFILALVLSLSSQILFQTFGPLFHLLSVQFHTRDCTQFPFSLHILHLFEKHPFTSYILNCGSVHGILVITVIITYAILITTVVASRTRQQQ